MRAKQEVKDSCTKPPTLCFKLKTHALTDVSRRMAGLRAVIQDDKGNIMSATIIIHDSKKMWIM